MWAESGEVEKYWRLMIKLNKRYSDENWFVYVGFARFLFYHIEPRFFYDNRLSNSIKKKILKEISIDGKDPMIYYICG